MQNHPNFSQIGKIDYEKFSSTGVSSVMEKGKKIISTILGIKTTNHGTELTLYFLPSQTFIELHSGF